MFDDMADAIVALEESFEPIADTEDVDDSVSEKST